MSVGRSVGRSICPYVFSQTVAVVYMYVGMCSVQQECGAVFKKSVFMAWHGPKLYTAIILGVH